HELLLAAGADPRLVMTGGSTALLVVVQGSTINLWFPKTMVSVDFFTVSTIRVQALYVFLVLAHDRRRILHVGVTAHPTATWTAQQLREAFRWETGPRYLLRDRDSIFGRGFVEQVTALGMSEVLSTHGEPWQRAYIERVIGTIRRECLNHVI